MKHRLDNGLKENPQNIQEHDNPKWDHLSLRDKAPACSHDFQSISLYEHFLLAYDKVPRSNEKPNDSLLLPISEQYKTNQKPGMRKLKMKSNKIQTESNTKGTMLRKTRTMICSGRTTER